MESFNGKLRDELLAIELFHSLLEAKAIAEDHRKHFNTYRPHSSLGYRTPSEFTLDWNSNNPESQRHWLTKRGRSAVLPNLTWVRFTAAAGTPQTYSQIMYKGDEHTKVFDRAMEHIRCAVELKKRLGLK